jgi:hypothetical protein
MNNPINQERYPASIAAAPRWLQHLMAGPGRGGGR